MWSEIDGGLIENVIFRNCKITNQHFYYCHLHNVKFINSELTQCKFLGADLDNVDFGSSKLTECELIDSIFTNVDLDKEGIEIYGAIDNRSKQDITKYLLSPDIF